MQQHQLATNGKHNLLFFSSSTDASDPDSQSLASFSSSPSSSLLASETLNSKASLPVDRRWRILLGSRLYSSAVLAVDRWMWRCWVALWM
jgi:hypothetical protein